ncbi:MAG TPA: FAD-dependent oxidoreductase [bacterium]|nr:FAD-dependent oxidoreductase [bacterium]
MMCPLRKATREIPVECDFCVVGGGMAGMIAAIAAAREGAQVVLIQDRPVLGGNASSEIRMHVLGAECSGRRNDVDSRESGILEEIRLTCAVTNPQRSFPYWDYILYDFCQREKNLRVFLNTHLESAKVKKGRIEQVLAMRPSTEDVFEIRATLFADCSGDGRLGKEAGADYTVGREAKSTYGESLGQERADRKTQGSSILFFTREHDRPMPFVPPSWIRKYPRCEDLPHRSHKSWEYGYWWCEWGGELDTIKDGDTIRHELYRIALGVWDHIKNQVDHGAERWALEWIGAIPGKRESRRFLGPYVLNQNDLQSAVTFPDAVSHGGWTLDDHPPAGIDSPEPACKQIWLDRMYSIPLRSLFSRNIRNLFFAGRNISASHVAFCSTRVMGTCAAMGQAVGAAAAVCLEKKCLPMEAADRYIRDIQQTLLRNDQFIPGIKNEDPTDLARNARITASSEQGGYAAGNVIDGVARMTYDGNHAWHSRPEVKEARIELDLGPDKRFSEVHITFDTGLHRPLAISGSQSFSQKMTWGVQPETVRNFRLEAFGPDEWHVIKEVQNNYQRKVVLKFDPVAASLLRLTCEPPDETQGVRIYEIRVYA